MVLSSTSYESRLSRKMNLVMWLSGKICCSGNWPGKAQNLQQIFRVVLAIPGGLLLFCLFFNFCSIDFDFTAGYIHEEATNSHWIGGMSKGFSS
jgi:hypothetical protein